jgi:hypothetical protein
VSRIENRVVGKWRFTVTSNISRLRSKSIEYPIRSRYLDVIAIGLNESEEVPDKTGSRPMTTGNRVLYIALR